MVTVQIPVYDPEHACKLLALRLPRAHTIQGLLDTYYVGCIYRTATLEVLFKGPEAPQDLPAYFVRWFDQEGLFVLSYHLRPYIEFLKAIRSLDAISE